MINVQRTVSPPSSLSSTEIQDYINAVIACKSNPSLPKPSKPPSYRNCDLLDAFDSVFFSKCYLTEIKSSNSYAMDVEHFYPKSERPELTFDWENLFPADHLANMMKPNITPSGGYLNPSNPKDDVELEIVYTLSKYNEDPYFQPRDLANIKAVNTCNLLNRIHNGHNEQTVKATQNLRALIQKKCIDILNKIIEWQNALDGTQAKFQAERELRHMLSRRSSFTMLCRSMPAVQQNIPAAFLD